MAKAPWRFQGDIKPGETDPMVTVFLGRVVEDDDGETEVLQDTGDPVQIKLSDFVKSIVADVKNPAKLIRAQSDARTARKAQRADPAPQASDA